MADGKQDEVDRVLDAALAKYAAAEPRTGLQERVLANMRAERARVPEHAWWRWGAMATVAAVVVVTLALAWRSGRPKHPVVATHPSATTQGVQPPGTHGTANHDQHGVRPQAPNSTRKIAGHQARSAVVIAAQPKLDQFPSPRPLSEQEKFLQAYVAEYPERAVLIARARTEELRQDQLEEMKGFPSGDRGVDSERNNDTTER